MRIGVSDEFETTNEIVAHVVEAEKRGISTVWFTGTTSRMYLGVPGVGDPLTAMVLAGRATSCIELGAPTMHTYPSHPLHLQTRIVPAVEAIGRPGLTLGLTPSHAPSIEGVYGMSYDYSDRHTEEYFVLMKELLAGMNVKREGEFFSVNTMSSFPGTVHPVPLLLNVFGPRLLGIAKAHADGVVLTMANAKVINNHIVRVLQVGKRIVTSLPVVVHDNEAEAREAIARKFWLAASIENYRWTYENGGISGPADAAIVGNEEAVARQIEELAISGATDLWALICPVGDDVKASRNRTMELLTQLAQMR